MKRLCELEKDDKVTLARKKFKVQKSEVFRLLKAKQDSARFIFLKSERKDYVLYLVNKKGRIIPSLEEVKIDKTKKQWWRNYQAIKKLKFSA